MDFVPQFRGFWGSNQRHIGEIALRLKSKQSD